MNKQEAIKKIEACKSPFVSEDDTAFNYGLDKALSIIKQLDEPEKPIVPQFVADWYEENKDDFEFNLYCLCVDFNCRPVKLDNRINRWFSNTSNKSIQTLVAMHFFGYEVEKEKLYTVELPNSNNLDYLMLQKDRRGKISVAWYCTDSWREDERVRLTEAEIKKDFPWAWQFAKEVKEND